ncbi:MAG: HAD-IIIA family hydrolase [Planctomycetes bacterium]|nr:HAD-IIIA family hydrolase [Planctomycetota bacterium]MCW8135205.1 HAD-IIIA family hydrolase [Planctomycetota bacterium]
MSVTEQEWAGVKLFATDVDGVLTDGTVLYGEGGELAKRFFIRDGMGLRLLEAAGVKVAVITSEDSPVVASRVRRLMLSAYCPGMKRKGDALKALMQQYGATPEQTVFIGDDVNDAEALQIAGISCAPADATEFARESARFVAGKPGGLGAVREIADLVLAAKGISAEQLWQSIHKQAESHDVGSV